MFAPPLIRLPAPSPRKDGEKFDFIDDFANRKRCNAGAGAGDSKLLPVLDGEKIPAGR